MPPGIEHKISRLLTRRRYHLDYGRKLIHLRGPALDLFTTARLTDEEHRDRQRRNGELTGRKATARGLRSTSSSGQEENGVRRLRGGRRCARRCSGKREATALAGEGARASTHGARVQGRKKNRGMGGGGALDGGRGTLARRGGEERPRRAALRRRRGAMCPGHAAHVRVPMCTPRREGEEMPLTGRAQGKRREKKNKRKTLPAGPKWKNGPDQQEKKEKARGKKEKPLSLKK